MGRIWYLLRRLVVDTISLLSRILNAWVFAGSTSQTLSARAHIEARSGSRKWLLIRNAINMLFFWEDDHCARWWSAEVERARYTLRMLDA